MPSSSSGSRSKRRGGGGGGRAAAAAAGVGTSKGGGKFEGEGRIGQNHNDDELEEEQEQKASTRSSGTLPTLHGISSPHSSAYTIASIDSMEGGGSAILWMSEAAMVSASLSASQPVAISVMVMGMGEVAGSYQLESLESLCSRHFNITVFQCLMDEPGVFCAIAVAWPCRKLVKNEVRLSKELANTLGHPSVRMNVLVSPLNVDITSFEAKIYRASASSNKTSAGVTLQECSRLCLRWCPPESAAKLYHEIPPSEAADNKWKSPEVSTDFWSPTSIAKDCVSQPGTPKTPHKFLDCSNLQMGSLLSPAFSDSKKIKLQPPGQSFTRDVNHMQMNNSVSALLEVGSNKSRELLEFFASRWLFGRVLLKGNFVTIPILGYSCVFNVIEAQSSLQAPNLADQDDTSGCTKAISCSRKEDSIPPEIFETFIVGSKTSISLLPPTVTVESTPGSFIENTDVSGTCNRQRPSKELGECMIPTLEKFKYSALGGLSEQIATLKEIIELSILRPELLTRLGLQPAKGVLLHGPPGTGKTSLAVASACEAGLKIFFINGPEIISEFYGESEAALQTVFASAQEAAPSVVFIDELDAIAPQRKEGSEELTQRMVAALLTLMDGGDENLHRVLVIAATNRLEAIDPALRRPGRFDREIEIGVPPPAGRCEILQKSLHQMSHTLGTSDVDALAAATHGFVGADLMALCNEAAMAALRRYVKLRDSCWRSLMKSDGSLLSLPSQEDIASQTHQVIEGMHGLHLSNDLCLATISRQGENDTVAESWLRVTHEDFEEAKSKVRPSAMREVMLEVPKVRWSDIGGQMEVKQQLQEAVEWPQKHGDALTRIGAIPPRGVLMYGPPGCSKTLMARAVATEAGLNFIAVKGPELFSKWVGESEKAVHALFERARAAAPSVVFFDEIDGLAVTRDSGHDGVSVGDRVMSQLLIEMDGINSRAGVTVIAATNRPDKIDPALLRPGRFDRLLYVGPPDEAARHEIFRIHMRKMPCASDVVESILVARTHGYSGADIAAVCRAAAMAALEEDLDASQVMMHHFEFALGAVQPSCKTVTEFSYPQFHWGLKTH